MQLNHWTANNWYRGRINNMAAPVQNNQVFSNNLPGVRIVKNVILKNNMQPVLAMAAQPTQLVQSQGTYDTKSLPSKDGDNYHDTHDNLCNNTEREDFFEYKVSQPIFGNITYFEYRFLIKITSNTIWPDL